MSVAAFIASKPIFHVLTPPQPFRLYRWHRLHVELTHNHNNSLIYTDGLQITVVCVILTGSLSETQRRGWLGYTYLSYDWSIVLLQL